MEDSIVREKVKRIMARLFKIDIADIPDEMAQENLKQWDSLMHLNLVVEIEREFKVSLEPGQIGRMTSLQAVCRILQNELQDRNP